MFDNERRAMLDPGERQVLQLLATGLSNREVAEHLGMPVDYVRAAVEAILRKLGARSTIEALIIAIRQNLIELPPN